MQTNKREARSTGTPTRRGLNSLEPNSSTTKPDSRSLPSLLWKKKSVVTGSRLSDNSYPTVPWARNKEALWAMQVGCWRAGGWESISNLLISQYCASHTHARTHACTHMHSRIQPKMHAHFCTCTINTCACTHPFSWTKRFPALKLLLRQSAALCWRGYWSRSTAHNSRSYLFLEGLNSPTHSTHSP